MKLIMENWRTFVEQEANNKYDASKYGPPIKSIDEFEEHLKNLNNLLLEGIEKKYFLITEEDESAAAVAEPADVAPEKQSWLSDLKGSLVRGVEYLKSMSNMGVKVINRIITSLASSVTSLMKKLPIGARKVMNKEMNTLANSLQDVVLVGMQGLAEEWKKERKEFKEAAMARGVWPPEEEFIARVKENEQAAVQWFWKSYGRKTLEFAKEWTEESRKKRAAELADQSEALMAAKTEEVFGNWEQERGGAIKTAKANKVRHILEVGTGGMIFGLMDNGGGDIISKVFIGDSYYELLLNAGWEVQAALESNFAMLNTGSDLIGGVFAGLAATYVIRKVAKALKIPGWEETDAKEGGMLETTAYIVVGCIVAWAYTTLAGAPWSVWLASAGMMEERQYER